MSEKEKIKKGKGNVGKDRRKRGRRRMIGGG